MKKLIKFGKTIGIALYPTIGWFITIAFRWPIITRVYGFTIWPFLIYDSNKIMKADQKKLTRMTIHEVIHYIQQKELLIIPFFILYILEYLAYLLYYRDHQKAYRSISFEREAYTHESNEYYISERKMFGMWRKPLSYKMIDNELPEIVYNDDFLPIFKAMGDISVRRAAWVEWKNSVDRSKNGWYIFLNIKGMKEMPEVGPFETREQALEKEKVIVQKILEAENNK